MISFHKYSLSHVPSKVMKMQCNYFGNVFLGQQLLFPELGLNFL